MRVYARKIFPHDITHEVSVRSDVVNDFFEGRRKDIHITGRRSRFKRNVTINSATDARFGGDFKSLLLDEGRVDVNDIVLIYKLNDSEYELEVVKQNDVRYFGLMVLFRGKARHAFLETEGDLLG